MNNNWTKKESPFLGLTGMGGGVASLAFANPEVGGYYSVGFDGAGDYLELANSTDFDFGSGDFTIECWVKVTGTESIKGLIAKRTSPGGATNTDWVIYIDGLKTRSWFSNGSSYFISDWTSSSDLNANQWNHLAIVRNGSTWKVYMNGTSAATRTDSGTITSNSRPLYIGADHPGNAELNGSVSNLRVLKGTALYTSNFTPPTSPLTNITNTKLLCCNQDTVTGASVTPGTISEGGDPTSSTDNPF